MLCHKNLAKGKYMGAEPLRKAVVSSCLFVGCLNRLSAPPSGQLPRAAARSILQTPSSWSALPLFKFWDRLLVLCGDPPMTAY